MDTDSPTVNPWAAWIKDWLRRDFQRSQGTLARTLSVDRSLIAHWISGRKKPSPLAPYWPKLLTVLGLDERGRHAAHLSVGLNPDALQAAA